MTDMFGNYQSQETRVLQSINSSKYPDTNVDLERNIQRLNSFVDYISQYLQVMQKGVDQANQDIFQRTRDIMQNFGVLLAGGAIFDNDFGDLQYFLPAIGALLGFDKDTPFPINLFHAAENLLLGYVVPLDAFGIAIMEQVNAWADSLNLNQEFMTEVNEWVAAVGELGAGFGELITNLFGMFDIFGVNEDGLGPIGDIWHGVTQLFGGFSLEFIGDLTDPILAALAPWLGRITDAVGWISDILKSWSNGLESLDGIINFSGLFGNINWAAPDFDLGTAIQEWINGILVPTNIFAHRVEFGTLQDLASELDEHVNNVLQWFSDIFDNFGLTGISEWIDDLLQTRGATNTALTNASTAQAKADLAEALANVGVLRAKFGSNILYSPTFENTTIQYWPYTSLAVSSYSYSTEYRHSGVRSLRVVYDGEAVTAGEQGIQMRVEPSEQYLSTQPQAWYWVEAWFYVYNTHSNFGRLQLFADAKHSLNVNAPQKVFVYDQPFSSITKDTWTKISGHIQVPDGLDQFTLVIARNGCVLNDVIFFDDMVMREVTEARIANTLATAAQALANTAQSVADTAWAWAQEAIANFAAILDRFGFGLIGDWIEDLFGVKTNATTAVANASTAITNAATAQATADTANTAAGTANTDIQTTVDYLNDAFLGTTGSTGTSKATMRQRGSVVRAAAVAGETNSATALTNAATADTKAVTAQSAAATADAKAVVAQSNAATADGKAVVAQGAADTANTLARAIVSKGDNLCTNPSFESDFIVGTNVVRTQEESFAGAGSYSLYSAKATLPDNDYYCFIYPVCNNQGGQATVPTVEGDTYYFECMVKGLDSNVDAGGTIWFQSTVYRTGGLSNTTATGAHTSSDSFNDGQWHKMSGSFTMPADTYAAQFYWVAGWNIANGNVYYVDEMVLRKVSPEAIDAQLDADAAANTASTALTNASTADAKAVVAQNRLEEAASAGASITTNPGFEDTSQFLGWGWSYSTEQAYTGTRSAKHISDGSNYVGLSPAGTTSGNRLGFKVRSGQVFYLEVYVRGRDGNVGTGTTGLCLVGLFYRADLTGSYISLAAPEVGGSQVGTGSWVKLTGTVIVPADRQVFYPRFDIRGTDIPAGDAYYVDNFNCYDITEAYYADEKAVAAQATIDLKAKDFANLAAGSDFEGEHPWKNITRWVVASDQSHSGTNSFKLPAGSGGGSAFLGVYPTVYEAKPGDRIYMEMWARHDSAYVSTLDGKLRVGRQDNSLLWYLFAMSTTGGFEAADTWTKLSTTFTVPAGVSGLTFNLQWNTTQGTLWLDDIVIRKVSPEAIDAQLDADAAAAQANTANANAATAQGQADTATSNAAIADTKAVAAQNAANTADGKAATADGKAVAAQNAANTADGKAVTAQTTANTANTAAGTANTNLQTTWNELVNAFDGTTTATGRTATNVRQRGAVVRTSAITGETNSATALTNAATADTKAANAQSAAVTADGKAVAAQNAASTADTKAVNAQNAASTADGKAVVAQSAAATADAKAVTADGKAVTADGKAVAAQNAASTADGKAVTADTKAVAAQGFAATALKSGGNILPNAGFENTSFYTANGVYDSSVKLSGSWSCRLTGSGVRINLTTGFTTNDTLANSLRCRPSSTFYVEGWVYGDPDNAGGGNTAIYVDDFNEAGVLQPQQATGVVSTTTALRGVWTKMSGKITVSASAASVYIFIYQSGQPAADKYYYDNFVAYEVTEADAAQQDADAAASTASTALTNASTATTNAAIADGKAATADGKAVAAQGAADSIEEDFTSTQQSGFNLIPNPGFESSKYPIAYTTYTTEDAHTGSQCLKVTFTSIPMYPQPCVGPNGLYKIRTGPARAYYYEFWAKGHADNTVYTGTAEAVSFGFWLYRGDTGAHYTNIRHVRTWDDLGRGEWVKFSGTVVVTNAEAMIGGTIHVLMYMPFTSVAGQIVYLDDFILRDVTEAYNADLNAAVADAKAVTATTNATIADGKAATADTKAVNAQNAANTADTKAVAAQGAASTADGKAVNAQNAASTADTKAVNAQNAANTADTKAVNAQNAANTADTKAVNADAKAVTATTNAANAETAATNAQGTADDATATGLDNASEILQLKAAQAGGTNSGVSATDTFNTVNSAGLDTANWDINITGVNGHLATDGANAYWVEGTASSGTTDEIDYWKTPTNTDFQQVSFIISAIFGFGFMGPVARCNAACNSYIYVKIETTKLRLYKVISGVETQIGTTYFTPVGQSMKSGDVVTLEAGVGDVERSFRVRRNSNIVINDTDTTSVYGASNRFAGFRYQMYYSSNFYRPGSIAAWSMADNAPPNYVGSGFRAVKGSGTQACSNNYNLLPNSFFAQEYSTADYTYTPATANKLQVSVSGWYHIEISLGLSINTMITDMAVALYKNGLVNKKAGSFWGAAGLTGRGPAAVAGSFIVYLSAGDYIQPGYWQTTVYSGTGTMVGDSNSTYFDVALINKSML